MKLDKYMPIIILGIFAIGIAFLIGMQIGWQNGINTAKVIVENLK